MRLKTNLAVALLVGMAAADDQPAGLLNALESVVTAETSQVQGGIQSLLSQANSLIQGQYPSTTITDLASLTWPTTVVIGSKTYTIPSTESIETSLSTSASPSSSSAIASTTENARPILTSTASSTISNAAPTSSSQTSQTRDPWDKRLGIVLGVVLGSVAVAIGAFLIWFLHRRRKNTGSFFKQRPSNPSDDEVSSWRNDAEAEKYGNSGAPPLLQPPMAAHNGYATRSWTNDDDDMYLGYGSRPDQHNEPAELSAERSDRGSIRETAPIDRYAGAREDRPPTPFSPESFSAMAASPVSPIEQEPQRRRSSGFWPPRGSSEGYRNLDSPHVAHQSSLTALAGSVAQDYPHPYYQNPFASSEDYDEDGYNGPYRDQQRHLSPTPDIPSRSPRRQSSPMVFYPSSDELGKFNFGIGEGRERRPSELGA
ncbi:unnamed protein product [Aureobasidium uvarum]|uniref:Uncharacterized protein n=1 Tax=Aureobasidium uvarum TaxID=2773716 RepID=A0A9N8KC66_9PEZI|nr:unnamed protein product [Aureobasidium uvarum]